MTDTYDNHRANRLATLGVEPGQTTLMLSVSDALKRRLTRVARERGISVSELACDLLERDLEGCAR